MSRRVRLGSICLNFAIRPTVLFIFVVPSTLKTFFFFLEIQACYSLGNTYTLLRDYQEAVEYHSKHLEIAQELGDRYKNFVVPT